MTAADELRQCERCKRDFPAELIQPFAASGATGLEVSQLCPICAYERIAELHGGERTPDRHRAPRAFALWTRAQEYLRRKKDEL